MPLLDSIHRYRRAFVQFLCAIEATLAGTSVMFYLYYRAGHFGRIIDFPLQTVAVCTGFSIFLWLTTRVLVRIVPRAHWSIVGCVGAITPFIAAATSIIGIGLVPWMLEWWPGICVIGVLNTMIHRSCYDAVRRYPHSGHTGNSPA